MAVNQSQKALDELVFAKFGWPPTDAFTWLSPIEKDHYAEYYDQSALDLLGLKDLKHPLDDFWPRGSPRWDGLAKTRDDRILLVEAKAYVEEGVDFRSKATAASMTRIRKSLQEAKHAFLASDDAVWDQPFYQYANRLAHLYFLTDVNNVDAFLLFSYFADAPDVPNPCSAEEWRGAERLTRKCLGLGNHPLQNRIGTIVWSVREMLALRSTQ